MMNWNEQRLETNQSIQEVVETLKQIQRHPDQPVLLFLATDGPAFQSEGDFHMVRQLQEEGAIPPIWGLVIPAERTDESVRIFAARQGFTFAETRDAAVDIWKTTERKTGMVSSDLPVIPSPVTTSRLRRRLPFAVPSLLLIIAAALAALLLRPPSLPVRPASQTRVGQVAFVTSTSGALNDEVQLSLSAPLPSLASGQVYTGWILTDRTKSDTVLTPSDTLWIRVGTLKTSGQQTLTPTDGSRLNLLAFYSRFCITASDPSFIPSKQADCRYYGEIPQEIKTSDPDQYSYRDHVRHLLSYDPTLETLVIHNGLMYNFNQQVGKVNEWATAANGTTGDMPLVHRHMVRILDALDGAKYVAQDVPAGEGILVDATSIKVGVLRGDALTPSYLGHIEKHLRGILSSPGVTAAQQNLASQILTSMETIAAELETVYNDARVLVRLSDAQLAHATGTFQELATNASNVYAGGYPTALSQTRLDGSKDLYTAFQQFGVFDIY